MAVILDVILTVDAASTEGHGQAVIAEADHAAGGGLLRLARTDTATVDEETRGMPVDRAAGTAWATGFLAGIRISRQEPTVAPPDTPPATDPFHGVDPASVRWAATQRGQRAATLTPPGTTRADLLAGAWLDGAITGLRYDTARRPDA